MTVFHSLWTRLPRPLDPLRSIKTKFGVLAMFNAAAAALTTTWGYGLGFRARYTLPVAVLVALILTQLVAHGMTAPLRQMTAAARAMARGQYGRQVRVTSRDEVGELGLAFNTMAADLAEVEKQRREFVANVSHELRTPITALRAVLENVADGVSPTTPEVLESALSQTDRLGRLVTQLLDLSRVEAGAVALDVAPFEVRPLLDTVVSEVQMNHPGPKFVVVTEPGLTAVADRDRLHQVIANLLDNAARHGPHDGRITVTAGGRDGGLLLLVTDEGPGIPVADRLRVFQRFSQGTSGTPDGGTGLGLAIARRLVDLHNGDVRVIDSDRGCHIRVTIPPPRLGAEASAAQGDDLA